MKKRLWAIILALAMVLSLLPITALAVDEGADMTPTEQTEQQIGSSDAYWSYDEETKTLTISGKGMVPGGTGHGADKHPWDEHEDEITKLVIKEGVTGTRGSKAFAGLKALTEITFGENFTTVGGGAFANCSTLKTVTLPETVNTLSSVAFSNCNNLETLYVCNRDITIPSDAKWTTTKALPDNLTVYGYQYTNDTRKETTALYNYIQAENDKLTDGTYTSDNPIKFVAYDDPENATGPIGDTGIIWKYTDATKTLTISGSGVVSFERGEDGSGTPWYQYRDLIEKVVFEKGVTGVSTTKAFAEMPMLSEIVFCDSLKSLGVGTFANNKSLETVTLPKTLESLGQVVFSNCQNLKSLTVENPNMSVSASQWSSDAVPGHGAADGLVVYCNKWTDDSKTDTTDFYDYVQYNNQNTKSNIIFVALDERKPVAEGSSIRWSYDEATKTLTITGKGDLAIENYQNEPWWNIRDSIETVIFGEGITGSTGTKTFAEMDKLSEVIFPSTFKKLGTGTFASDPSLEHITLPESLESIGTVVFSNCQNLKTIVIKNRTMEAPTTDKWSSDTVSPNVPQNLTVYGYQWTDDTKGTETDFYQYVAWQNGQNDGNITFIALDDPNATAGVIGDSETFWSYDEETTTLTISGEGMVPGGTGLGADMHPWDKYEDEITKLVIEEGVTGTRGSKAFAGMDALTEIQFPNSFTTIGGGTFANCPALEKVTLPETIEYLSSVVFSNCDSLKELRVENRNIDVSCVIDGKLDDGDEEDISTTWSTTGTTPEGLKVYGYANTSEGGDQKTEIYTYITGNSIEFVDLDSYAGDIGENLSWTFDGDTLTISGDGEIPGYNDGQTPWSNFNSQIKHIVVEKGITAIGANAFSEINDLETAEINRTVSKIEEGAFNAEDNFTIRAKRGSAALEYANAHENIETDEIVTANILFIGNSYTEDAREYLRYVFDQYDFDADVNFGHLYSGGKTVAYYANCARNETNNSDEYGEGDYDTTSPRAFEDDDSGFNADNLKLNYYLSVEESIAFTSQGVKTIANVMNSEDWDIVIIQGHDVEQASGDKANENFASNLNYLTNYIKSFDPSVEIGYYMTWQRNQEIGTGRIDAYWTTMEETVLGENSKVSFVIPVGTAVENARTTFLGELKYESTNENFNKVNLITGTKINGTVANDNNDGLQRDNTHMSAVVGRFLAGYTIGEYLIDHINEMDGANFTDKNEITEIYSFDTEIGKLPAMYVDAIKASAEAAFKEPYEKTELTAYDDPMTAIKTAVEGAEYKFADLATDDAVKTAIEKKLASLTLAAGTQMTVGAVTLGADGSFTAEVEVQFGYLSATVEIEGSCAEEQPEPEPEPTPDPDEPDVPDIPANPSYQITMPAAEGGSVTANPTAAKKGDTVTLTVTPEDGYELADLTVTDFWGKDVALTKQADGTYTFTMPGSQVEIEATFTQAGEPEPELPFTDVTEADWFYDEVQYVVDNGLMIGTSDTTFDPNGTTTRAMVWTILARMDGETITGSTWVEDARAWAMENEVSDGTGADDAVTREQLVTMLWRYVGEPAGTGDLSGFADADTVSGWAEEAMSWSVGTGLIVGDENGLTPTATAIRAQIAAILMRFCENVAK